jgi:hypothetical protein
MLLANCDFHAISGAVFSRRSSAVEHPLRKRVVGGSNPSAGTVLFMHQDFPNIIEMAVPPNGFGERLDSMYA